ncbi:MAG: hypothetical protein M3Z85_10250 [Acidobacteriota bacterium]|nr:hypothetical protein [Acidobacteriota bacterium]
MIQALKTAALFAVAGAAWAGAWTEPVRVTYDDKPCISYRARMNGDYLEVQATVEPGWHTFAMDNKRRQQEKLAGKPSLGIERQTEIVAAKGLALSGPWFQSQPKDLSKPEIRWFTWGFEQQALFAAKAKRAGAGPAQVTVRGQACSADICKNIDVSLTVPPNTKKAADSTPVDLKALVQVH